MKLRFYEIVEAINSRDSLLEEFDEEIFNALVEKIEILTPAHFVFELKSGKFPAFDKDRKYKACL